ncbi:MAG TPA: hypothetical protein VH859_07105 [Candidatus Limnocylindria bacterium]|jgi:hypothetical protein
MLDDSVVAIARIPLARAPLRILLAPIVLAVVGLGIGVVGWLVAAGDVVRWSALALAAAAVAGAVLLGMRMLSVGLEVEVSTLRVRRLGADLRFTLVRGAVTRIPLSGEGAARVRQRLGPFGWGAGSATLRGEERIHTVRLAPTRSLILVPTDAGRVAIAAASEEQLIAALGAAARVQQRLDQVAARARSLPIDRLVEEPPPVVAPLPPVPDHGRVLTGIERVQLEQRLAAERAAAIAAAEAERQLAAEEAARAAAEAEQRAAMAALVTPERPARAQRPTLRRPMLQRPKFRRPAITRPRLALPELGHLPQEAAARYLVVVVPLLLATVVWAYATVSGRLDLAEDEARLVGLTLALVGPAAAIGALVARTWFPRLLGLVAVSSVCALVLAGRALLA